METIKVKFDELYSGINTPHNFFTRHLSAKYKVEISGDPDFYYTSFIWLKELSKI